MQGVPIQTVFIAFEVIVVLILLGVIFFFWRQAQKNKHQRHTRKVIDSLSVKHLHDVVLPDGVDGLIFIDYLLLVPTGFVVLKTEYSEGILFGGESVDQWSQVINNKTYKFNNPLYDNQTACQALQWNLQHNLEGIDETDTLQWQVDGWVVFSNAGNFPKGIPAKVSMIDELKSNLSALTGNSGSEPDETLLKAWDALHNLSISTRAANKHLIKH